jgi:SH3-like domain-containing protein
MNYGGKGINVIGKTFGKLSPVKRKHKVYIRKNYMTTLYVCVCDCGQIEWIRKSDLLSGERTACKVCTIQDKAKTILESYETQNNNKES